MEYDTIKPIVSFRQAVIIALILLIIFCALTFFLPDERLKLIFSDLLLPLAAILASFSLFYAAKCSKIYSKKLYIAWMLIAAGQLFGALGAIAWLIFELILNQQPFPSLADVFYLTYYPLFLAGIFYLPFKHLTRTDRANMILDISIVMVAALLLFWNFLIGPTLELSAGQPLWAIILSVAYPIFDLMLIFPLLMLIFQRFELKNQWPLLLLMFSSMMMIITDSFFGYQSILGVYISGGPLDIGYMVAYILAGLAGILQANNIINTPPNETKKTDTPPKSETIEYKTKQNNLTLYLPYLWVLIPYFLLIWSHYYKIYTDFLTLALGVFIIIGLTITRQILTLNENRWLNEQLQNAHDKLEMRVKKRTAELVDANEELQNEIIERKKAEEELELKARLLDAATDSIMLHDMDGNPLYMNQTTYTSRGYTKDEMMNLNLRELEAQEYRTKMKTRIKDLIENGEAIFETANYRKDQSVVPVEIHAQIIESKGKKLILGVARDITQRKINEAKLKNYQEHLEELVEQRTGELEKINQLLLKEIDERKHIEKALKESESAYKAIFENTGTATMIVEEDTSISLINAEAERLTGYLKEEIEGKRHWIEFIYKDDLEKMKTYHQLRRTEPLTAPKTYEARGIFKEGKIRNVIITVDIIPGTTKSVASFLDITERKQAEKQIKASLKEKEVLLREVHHRVKNNMQIISSLLNIQTYQITDKKALNIFKESQNRVKSMAMIHEKLYQSKDLTLIDFSDYIASLTSSIFSSYETDLKRIKWDINAEHILIGVDTAIPCGLIINELVTNSLKHGFVDGRKGKITIDLHHYEKDKFKLTVKDDGINFPENIDFKNTKTVGLQLINGLVEQLDGTIELDRSHGTEFTIIFKELKYTERI
ncbi:MAG: PAS domain S-box protein [Methanobacterium sp.]|uniref:PAS domain S-box protein n=1 Tax=Methanobacterium sp. TaxID=2164 RepID=UPI003D646CC2|nr:PAS domain S-box protein [Methanobacterium sp.]